MINRILNFAIGSFTVGNILAAVIAFAIGRIVVKYVMRMFERALERSHVDTTLMRFINHAARILLYFVLVVIVADCLNISIVSMVAVFSVAGLAVSLAAENSLSNLAGGVLLLVLKPFKVGDFIEASGNSGTVVDLGLIYTELLTIDNKHIYIPNKDVSSEDIINYSKEENRRVDIKINVDYNSDAGKVKKVLLDTVRATEGIFEKPEPFVRLSDYKDSSVEYTIRVWCRNADYWDVYFNLLESLKPALNNAGVDITYNHLNVHIIDEKTDCSKEEK